MAAAPTAWLGPRDGRRRRGQRPDRRLRERRDPARGDRHRGARRCSGSTPATRSAGSRGPRSPASWPRPAIDHRVAIVVSGVALLAGGRGLERAHEATRTPGEAVGGTKLSVSAFRRHPGLLAGRARGAVRVPRRGRDGHVGRTLRAGDARRERVGRRRSCSWRSRRRSSSGACSRGRSCSAWDGAATILLGGAVAAVAGAAIAATDRIEIVGAAYLVMGFALSAVAPAGFGLVERRAAGDQANAIAAVTTLGYAGFVFSPPLVGLMAQEFGLRSAMAADLLVHGGGPRRRMVRARAARCGTGRSVDRPALTSSR